ncbi:MAG: 50S ribosomal protein L6 [Planctomycetes bacterium]|jgi:large subunit ribosomal protein L6|nr:50S ribosomal protein L6 [Planctomycetota bacterium]
MSRVGKMPITIPAGVQVKLTANELSVKGPKGELKLKIASGVTANVSEKEIVFTIEADSEKKVRALWGLTRNLANNMVIGVTSGFSKKLEINGVGYKVALNGKKLLLNLGYSHPIDFPLPEGISAVVEANTVTISGIDKYLVGEISAQIRKLREPEPYLGKGIKYSDEVIRRKEGKAASK